MSWTDEQKAEMIKLCSDRGNSATTTASILGKRWGVRMTRNMVIGVVNRAGKKCGSAETSRQRRSHPRKSAVKLAARPKSPAQKAGLTAADPLPPLEITIDRSALKPNQDVRALQIIANDASTLPPPGAQGILRRNAAGNLEANPDLGEHACRWPLADPKIHPECFCAKQKVKGLPYCEEHARRAYAGLPPAKTTPQQPARRFEKVS